MDNNTIVFSSKDMKKIKNKELVAKVYEALQEKGYDAKRQLIGYLLSEDPTYITSHNGARTLATKIDRYELVEDMLQSYLEK
jgi:uncharacterized protein (UPF0297 family)